MIDTIDNKDFNKIVQMLDNINKRLTAIESTVNIRQPEEFPAEDSDVPVVEKENTEDMEFRLGEQWFGKIGIIAFMLAVVNFLVLQFGSIPQSVIISMGFLISFGLISSSFLAVKILDKISGYTMGSGFVILFISVMRLHFFSAEPVIGSKSILIILLLIVTGFSFAVSLRRGSAYLTSLSFLFLYTVSLISDQPLFIFGLLLAGSFFIVYIDRKYNWEILNIFGIVFTYLIHLLWFINNPLIGKDIMITEGMDYNILALASYTLVYGIGNAVKQKSESDDYYIIQKTIFNSLLGYVIFLFIAFNSSYNVGLLNLGISIVLLYIAALHWTKQKSKFSTFLYSMLAYSALSVAIIITFRFPDYFIWLCWQSIAVVSTALWFRSKFIVVANFIIFLMIILAYMVSAEEPALSVLSFGIVALISARIMNWQRERLELQTENLRIGYLIVAFLVIPYVLYINLPNQFVGISYILLAFAYYVLGKLINNKKYRLMASGTVVLSIIYIFIFGLTSSDTLYKIFSFLLVSIALIIISIVYAKTRSQEKENK